MPQVKGPYFLAVALGGFACCYMLAPKGGPGGFSMSVAPHPKLSQVAFSGSNQKWRGHRPESTLPPGIFADMIADSERNMSACYHVEKVHGKNGLQNRMVWRDSSWHTKSCAPKGQSRSPTRQEVYQCLCKGTNYNPQGVGLQMNGTKRFKKVAYVAPVYGKSVFDRTGFCPVCVALASLVCAGTELPFVFMHTPEVDRRELQLMQQMFGVQLREVPHIDPSPECLANIWRNAIAGVLMKLNIWSLTEWDRLMVFDADMLFHYPPDPVFEMNPDVSLAAAPRSEYHTIWRGEFFEFQGGMMVVRPDLTIFETLRSKAGQFSDCTVNVEQPFYDEYGPEVIGKMGLLPQIYNCHRMEDKICWKGNHGHLPVHVVHFAGPHVKPWRWLPGTERLYQIGLLNYNRCMGFIHLSPEEAEAEALRKKKLKEHQQQRKQNLMRKRQAMQERKEAKARHGAHRNGNRNSKDERRLGGLHHHSNWNGNGQHHTGNRNGTEGLLSPRSRNSSDSTGHDGGHSTPHRKCAFNRFKSGADAWHDLNDRFFRALQCA